MKEWFNELERREQWIVIAGAVTVLLYVLYMSVLAPINDKIATLQLRNKGAAETLQVIQQGAQEINALRGASSGGSGRGVSLSKMVDQSAAKFNIRVSRFQPSGNNEAQVWLEKVDFNQLIAWLDQMENGYGVAVSNVSMNSANNPGTVNARVRFRKGA